MAIHRLIFRGASPGMASFAAKGSAHAHAGVRFSSTVPVTVVDGSFWRSLIPKPLRKENRDKLNAKMKKDWNPATYFIVMFLFIGSMSIQMIALRHQSERYMRQSSIRIAQLREVVRRIQNGEDVEVEKVLGTRDPQKEADWEEVLQAIEREETMRKPQKQEKPQQPDAQTKSASQPQSHVQQPVSASPPRRTKTANFGNFF